MKTIEEKAKAYDEAFRIAQELYNSPNSSNIGKGYIYTIFPELKESEDERIRKEIISHVQYLAEYYNDSMPNYGKWLDWLEKQGEPVEINPTEFDTRLQSLIGKFGNLPKEELIGSLSFWLNMVQNDRSYKDEEKQGEQKLADKVEPRFKIEEEKWYVCTQTYVLRGKIVVIKGQTYQAEKDNVIKGEDGCLFIDRHDGKASDYFRSWTIDNAKNDDVLCYKNEISLYKHDIKNCTKQGTTFGGFVYYCCYDGKRFIVDSLYSLTEQDKMDIHPATKEQRDTLMKAMADAGYIFNFEKKELKKRENEIEIPFGAKDSELQEATYYIPKGFYAKIEDDKVVVKKGEKPTAWSEEDRIRITNCIQLIGKTGDGEVEWLKSLESRILPQTKQEWGEEDEAKLKSILFHIEDVENKDVIVWLKSLKDRYTWKPSEEQLKSLQKVIDAGYFTSYPNSLETLYEELKQL